MAEAWFQAGMPKSGRHELEKALDLHHRSKNEWVKLTPKQLKFAKNPTKLQKLLEPVKWELRIS